MITIIASKADVENWLNGGGAYKYIMRAAEKALEEAK